MKIFVTGAAGTLGSEVVRQAIKGGHTVVAVDIVPPAAEQVPCAGITFHLGTFENLDEIDPLMAGCDALFHAAGLHGAMVGKAGLDAFLQSNVVATARMLEAAHRHGIRRVALSSTSEIVLGRDWLANGMSALDENSPPRCDSPYSLSRLLIEQLAAQMAQPWGMSIACLRYTYFDSREDLALGVNLLARMISVRDVGRAVFAALQSPHHLNGEVFHIGVDTPLTNRDIGAASIDPVAVVERHYPGAAAILERENIALQFANFWPLPTIEKAKKILNWSPQITFEWWLRQHGWNGKCGGQL